ncbi:MAG: hypothetical protein E6I75_28950 [Chloroflexi bacterium]|nr:MAG: hypothetical protein E6I75_28950 [Chloroflexota bacterium]
MNTAYYFSPTDCSAASVDEFLASCRSMPEVAGQTLARLDSTDLQAAVDQAQATLNQQQANLAKVAAGATPEQAALAQAQISAAQTTFDGAQKS